MDPIFIILYAVIVTMLLTLVVPRLPKASPAVRRALWAALVIGGLAFLVIAWLVFQGSGGLAASEELELQERISRVENGLLFTQSITERMKIHQVPGVSLAVINNYELEWGKAYGVVELGSAEPVRPATLFQAGSVAKPVTAVGALHFVEGGLLELDDNVNDRLVSWKIPENEFTARGEVTLRRLLSHTAGVNQGLNRGYAPGEEVPTLLQALEGAPPANSLPVRLDRVPGTENYYSNGGYLIVAQLLQDVGGKPFPQVMQEAVFGPVGMTSSTFEQTLPAELEARTATPHGWDVVAWQEAPGLVGQAHVHDPGYGGLWTTAPDLALFGIAVMRAYAGESETLLSQPMVRLMGTPVTEGVPMQAPFEVDQGLGFDLLSLGQETWFIHFGGSFPGYISVLLLQPERGFGVAMLTNSFTGYELIWEILYSIFYAYGILPQTGQIIGMGYGLLLFVAAFLLWPASEIARRFRTQNVESIAAESEPSKAATIARLVALLTVSAVLVLMLRYWGPLGGYQLHPLWKGEPLLNKVLLGIFFSTPIFLVFLTVMVWRKRYWSIQERVTYTLVVAGALSGVYLLRSLWALMFWG